MSQTTAAEKRTTDKWQGRKKVDIVTKLMSCGIWYDVRCYFYVHSKADMRCNFYMRLKCSHKVSLIYRTEPRTKKVDKVINKNKNAHGQKLWLTVRGESVDRRTNFACARFCTKERHARQLTNGPWAAAVGLTSGGCIEGRGRRRTIDVLGTGLLSDDHGAQSHVMRHVS